MNPHITLNLTRSLRHLRISAYYLWRAILTALVAGAFWLFLKLYALCTQVAALFRAYRTVCILSMVILLMGILQLISVMYIYKLRAAQDLIELNQQRIVHESDSIRHAEIRYRSFHSNI